MKFLSEDDEKFEHIGDVPLELTSKQFQLSRDVKIKHIRQLR